MTLLQHKVKISDDALTQKLGDGLVVMNLSTEHFYELDEVGKRFWELLAEQQEITSAVEALLQEYEVSEDVLKQDMSRMIESLVDTKLISVY